MNLNPTSSSLSSSESESESISASESQSQEDDIQTDVGEPAYSEMPWLDPDTLGTRRF